MATLSIRLDLLAKVPPAGHVILTNTGQSELRLWRMGNTWGDATLSFEMTAAGSTETVTRTALCYTRNVPSSVAVAPGESHTFQFDLGDGTWQPEWRPRAILTAIYTVPETPESVKHGVWIGSVRTAPASLE